MKQIKHGCHHWILTMMACDTKEINIPYYDIITGEDIPMCNNKLIKVYKVFYYLDDMMIMPTEGKMMRFYNN